MDFRRGLTSCPVDQVSHQTELYLRESCHRRPVDVCTGWQALTSEDCLSQVHPGSSSSYSLTSSQPFASCLPTAPTLPPLLSQAQTSLPGQAWPATHTHTRTPKHPEFKRDACLCPVTFTSRVSTLCFSSQNRTSMTAASHVRETRPERVFLHSASHFPFFWCFFDDSCMKPPPSSPTVPSPDACSERVKAGDVFAIC